jgi:ethanolamine utilization protein EutN
MQRGIVTGSVWITNKIDNLPKGAYLEVRLEPSGASLIAFDVLGSARGEEVLIVTGSTAANHFSGLTPPIDALIVGSIDPVTESSSASGSTVATGTKESRSRASTSASAKS